MDAADQPGTMSGTGHEYPGGGNSTALHRDVNFERYLEQKMEKVTDAADSREMSYVTIAALEEYWDETAIDSALFAQRTAIEANSKTIQGGFLRVWSILVHIGRPECIVDFISSRWDDDNLPMEQGGGPCRRYPGLAFSQMKEAFCSNQWPFAPVQFLSKKVLWKRELDPRCVVPVDYEKVLTKVVTSIPTTIVRRVRLRDGCTDFEKKVVVFKEYQNLDDHSAWAKEVAIFTMGARNNNPSIVEYLGSFVQNNKFVVILEYANGGNLLDLFKENQQPRNWGEITEFWESLMKLFTALNHLHSMYYSVENQRRVGCAHRDIKPSNILVFRNGEASPSNIEFKLTDFDTATSVQEIESNSGIQDNDGNNTYRAPEASPVFYANPSSMIEAPLSCDVWSFGCVLSECLVWIAGGEAGRTEYRNRRMAETAKLEMFKGHGLKACFHNGTDRLDCVNAQHDEAMDGLKKFDTFTPMIRELIEERMLQPQVGRSEARQVWYHYSSRRGDFALPEHRQSRRHRQRASGSTNGSAGFSPTTDGPPSSVISQKWPAPTSPGIFGEMYDNVDDLGVMAGPRNSGQGTREPSGLLAATRRPNSSPPVACGDSTCIPSSATYQRMSMGKQNLLATPQPSQDDRVVSFTADSRDEKMHKRLSSLSIPPGVHNRPSAGRTYQSEPAPRLGYKHQKPETAPFDPLATQKETEPYPHVAVGEVLDWKSNKRRGNLPGRDRALRELKGREQVFVIDDSTRMTQFHRKEVIRTASALMYLVKQIDPNGIEMRFASEPERSYKGQKLFKAATKHLVDMIGTRFDKIDAGPCNMEQKLNAIIGAVISPGFKTSITVLTDGVWESRVADPGGGVENSITSLIDYMRKYGMKRTDVSIQFVRFGDDPVGKARLKYLDDDLQRDYPRVLGFDIVDQKPYTGSIWPMLVGALSRAVDNLPERPPHESFASSEGKETNVT